MARIELKVKYIKLSYYERPAYAYGYETVYIHKFQDDEGKIYVWKTTNGLSKEFRVDDHGISYTKWEIAYVGSVLKISASIKEESEYKGEKQIVLQRVKIIDFIERGLSYEEKEEIRKQQEIAKKQEQLDSIKECDFIWEDMPYSQYKDHYSDCEVIIGSFSRETGVARVDVIIREGRMKNSGVRGKFFNHYVLKNSKGQEICFYAVSKENALKQAMKYMPEETWEHTRVW